jgi:hypothetical protein
MLVDDNDSPMRKRKDLNVGYFDGPFFSMIFHFLAAKTGVRTACPFSFIFMLVTAFFECYFPIVGRGYGENPTSKRNYLDFQVRTVYVLPGLDLTKEFLSEKPFCRFARKKS